MIPWPIALLTLFYAVIATASAAKVWKILAGVSEQAILWPLSWFVLFSIIMCGLPLLKPWARRLAVFGSLILMIACLAVSALLIVTSQPIGALCATVASGVQFLMIRYLRRPFVRAYFSEGAILPVSSRR